MLYKVKDKVEVLNSQGNRIADGIIININDYREPHMKYAVDIVGFADAVFVGEWQIKPIGGMTLEGYLRFFQEQGVSIQITLDVGRRPNVYALHPKKDFERTVMKTTEADTLLEALEQMKVKVLSKED